MGYKKITVAKSASSKRENPPPFIESVSAVEIGTAFGAQENIKPKKPSIINKSALFISLCILSALIFAFIPIPEPVSKALFKITACFSQTVEKYSSGYIPGENIPDIKNTSYLYMDVPAATKSEQGNELPIFQASSLDLKAKNSLSISNETKYKINSDSLFSQKFPVRSISLQKQNDSDILPVFSAASPEVLIIHTHGTEGYSDSAFTNYRTCDTSKNVVAVGRKLKSALENQGVAVLHCEEMFDKDSYIKSYSKSFAAVSEYLSKYPSIKYVIDLHRDAVSDGNGGYARLVCKNDGEALAQLMLVIGTDEAGAKHKNWAQNLRVAAEIQKDLFEENSGIVRPINLRKASFNQQLLPGYFILEAGNCGNDLSEVISSMNVFAKSFAKTISSSM